MFLSVDVATARRYSKRHRMATVAAAKKRRGELQEYEARLRRDAAAEEAFKKQQRNAGQKEKATSLPESGTAKDAAVAKNANKAKDQTKDKEMLDEDDVSDDSDAGEGIGMAWERWRKRRLRLLRRRWPGGDGRRVAPMM